MHGSWQTQVMLLNPGDCCRAKSLAKRRIGHILAKVKDKDGAIPFVYASFKKGCRFLSFEDSLDGDQ